jgi:hypothetical protein
MKKTKIALTRAIKAALADSADRKNRLAALETRIGDALESSVKRFCDNRKNRRIRFELLSPSMGSNCLRLVFWTHEPRAKGNTIFGGSVAEACSIQSRPKRPRSTILAIERRSIRLFANRLQKALRVSVSVSSDMERDRLLLDLSPC